MTTLSAASVPKPLVDIQNCLMDAGFASLVGGKGFSFLILTKWEKMPSLWTFYTSACLGDVKTIVKANFPRFNVIREEKTYISFDCGSCRVRIFPIKQAAAVNYYDLEAFAEILAGKEIFSAETPTFNPDTGEILDPLNAIEGDLQNRILGITPTAETMIEPLCIFSLRAIRYYSQFETFGFTLSEGLKKSIKAHANCLAKASVVEIFDEFDRLIGDWRINSKFAEALHRLGVLQNAIPEFQNLTNSQLQWTIDCVDSVATEDLVVRWGAFLHCLPRRQAEAVLDRFGLAASDKNSALAERARFV